MTYYIDVVTEDSFYENLTLGVVKILENTTCVKNVRVERKNGCDVNSITNWEQKHCCILPEDMKNFYASIDGFSLMWNLEIAGEEFQVGRMEIEPLSSLKRYSGKNKDKKLPDESNELETERDIKIEYQRSSSQESTTIVKPSFETCKLFELANCFPNADNCKVCLVYQMKSDSLQSPEIWLYQEETDDWDHLADSFTIYFRMMLVHLGLPLWQCCVVGIPLSTWVEHIYLLVGPHLLQNTIELTETVSSILWNEGPANVIDPSIFKGQDGKQKNSRKK